MLRLNKRIRKQLKLRNIRYKIVRKWYWCWIIRKIYKIRKTGLKWLNGNQKEKWRVNEKD